MSRALVDNALLGVGAVAAALAMLYSASWGQPAPANGLLTSGELMSTERSPLAGRGGLPESEANLNSDQRALIATFLTLAFEAGDYRVSWVIPEGELGVHSFSVPDVPPYLIGVRVVALPDGLGREVRYVALTEYAYPSLWDELRSARD